MREEDWSGDNLIQKKGVGAFMFNRGGSLTEYIYEDRGSAWSPQLTSAQSCRCS